MRHLSAPVANLWRDESGISSVEYALLLAFVGAAIIVAAHVLSDSVGNQMVDSAGCIGSGGATCN